jgi:hypothetical protein
MGVSTRLTALPAAQPKDDREGPPSPDTLTLSPDMKKGNQFRLPAAALRPDGAQLTITLTRSDAQHPDADGYERRSCPALGEHPGLMCPLRETSLSPRDGRAKVLQPPGNPPKLCRQTAITIAPDIGARYRQDLPHGSPAWHTCYATLRNTIEGLNGYAKDTAHHALAQPGRRRVRGIAAQSIFTALLLLAANIRKIRAWRARTTDGTAGIARRARRRRTSLTSHLPDG